MSSFSFHALHLPFRSGPSYTFPTHIAFFNPLIPALSGAPCFLRSSGNELKTIFGGACDVICVAHDQAFVFNSSILSPFTIHYQYFPDTLRRNTDIFLILAIRRKRNVYLRRQGGCSVLIMATAVGGGASLGRRDKSEEPDRHSDSSG